MALDMRFLRCFDTLKNGQLVRWRGSQLNPFHSRKIPFFLLGIKNTAINTAKSFSEGIFVVCMSTSLTNAHDGLAAGTVLPRKRSEGLAAQ